MALNVIPPRVWPELGPGDDDDLLDLRVRVEREDLTSAETVVREAALPFGGGAVRPIVDEGPVAETILERSRRLPADLVVIGSRGAAGPHRPFWGSTAERITVSASCAVLVVPEPIRLATETPNAREGAPVT